MTDLIKKIERLKADLVFMEFATDVCTYKLRELEFQRLLHTPCYCYKVNG